MRRRRRKPFDFEAWDREFSRQIAAVKPPRKPSDFEAFTAEFRRQMATVEPPNERRSW